MRLLLEINVTDGKNDKYDKDFCKRLKNKCATKISVNSTVFQYYSFYMSLPRNT
jgi:hypothetical protein